MEKSGAVVAFLTLGLSVVVSRNDWHLRRRWGDGITPALAPHSNLFPISCWGQALSEAPYKPATSVEVAIPVLQGLGFKCSMSL